MSLVVGMALLSTSHGLVAVSPAKALRLPRLTSQATQSPLADLAMTIGDGEIGEGVPMNPMTIFEGFALGWHQMRASILHLEGVRVSYQYLLGWYESGEDKTDAEKTVDNIRNVIDAWYSAKVTLSALVRWMLFNIKMLIPTLLVIPAFWTVPRLIDALLVVPIAVEDKQGVQAAFEKSRKLVPGSRLSVIAAIASTLVLWIVAWILNAELGPHNLLRLMVNLLAKKHVAGTVGLTGCGIIALDALYNSIMTVMALAPVPIGFRVVQRLSQQGDADPSSTNRGPLSVLIGNRRISIVCMLLTLLVWGAQAGVPSILEAYKAV